MESVGAGARCGRRLGLCSKDWARGESRGLRGRPDQVICPVSASRRAVWAPFRSVFSGYDSDPFFSPAGQLAWSLEPGRLPWPHTGLSGCWQWGCGAWALGLRCGGTWCPGRRYLLGVSDSNPEEDQCGEGRPGGPTGGEEQLLLDHTSFILLPG